MVYRTDAPPSPRPPPDCAAGRRRRFDAISGIADLTGDDCAKLATTNTCTPLRGTCVEFLVDGSWTEAADLLAVTPTFLMVRSPFTCTAPTQVRVRRNVRDGGEAVSEPLTICTN